MAQLTKGMYGTFFDSKSLLFKLCSGQLRDRKTMITRNSGWYNKLGEKLGSGDLNVADFRRISRGLKKGELFIILSEKDSKWRFHYRINGQSIVNLPEEAPGVIYMIQNAMYVIARKKFYLINHYSIYKEKIYDCKGLIFQAIDQDAFKRLIKTGIFP